MRVRSFTVRGRPLLHVMIPAAADVASLPLDIRNLLAEAKPWKEYDLQEGQPRVGLNVVQALHDLQARGFRLNQAVITTTVTDRSGRVMARRQYPTA